MDDDGSNTANNQIQTTGLKRDALDKFYTAENIMWKCIELVSNNIVIDKINLCGFDSVLKNTTEAKKMTH